MTIKILGPGCVNCKTLYRRTEEALSALNLSATLEKVEEIEAIARHGVLRTPGLVIDNAIVWQGSVPPVEKIKALISAQMNKASTA